MGEVTVTDHDVSGLIVQGYSLYQVKGVMEDVYGEPFYAPIKLEGEGKRFWSDQTDDGFAFYNVPEGTYHVRFYSPVYENVRDSTDQIVVNQSIDDLKITLSVPTYSVSGMAYQSDGTPYSNESIHLQDSYGASWSTDITTAEDGSFIIHGLPNMGHIKSCSVMITILWHRGK